MRAPKKIKRGNREYILVKTYKSYALYKDKITKTKECFVYHDLGLIKENKRLFNIKYE